MKVKKITALLLCLLFLITCFLFVGCISSVENIFKDFVDVCEIEYKSSSYNSRVLFLFGKEIKVSEEEYNNASEERKRDYYLSESHAISYTLDKNKYFLDYYNPFHYYYFIDNSYNNITGKYETICFKSKCIARLELNISVKIIDDNMFQIKIPKFDYEEYKVDYTIQTISTDSFRITHFN